MAPPLPKKPMSFHELMEGLGEGHKRLALQPGAQRLPSSFRQLKPGELPLEVLERYNREGIFKLRSGEPLQVTMVRRPSPKETPESFKKMMERGELPQRSALEFRRQGESTPLGQIEIREKELSDIVDDPGQVAMRNQMAQEGTKPPRIFGLDTSDIAEGVGREGYAAVLDMIRAADAMNAVDVLTSVNKMRRPGNVMSYGLAHGDYRGVPLAPATRYDPLMFEESGAAYDPRRYGAEDEALKRIVRPEAGLDTAQALSVRDAGRYSDDAKTGLLALREMQIAKGSAAPDESGRYGRGYFFERAHPMDLEALERQTRLNRALGAGAPATFTPRRAPSDSDRYSSFRGFGPGLLGRAATTEALLGGLQYGRTVDDLVQELLSYPGAMEAIRGRYAKGGLVSALQG